MNAWIEEYEAEDDTTLLLIDTRSYSTYQEACRRLRAAGYQPNDDLEIVPFEDVVQNADGDEFLISDDIHSFTITLPMMSDHPDFDAAYDAVAAVLER